MTIAIEDYRHAVEIDLPWQRLQPPAEDLDGAVADLVRFFAAEAGVPLGAISARPIEVLRALLTRREPRPIPAAVQARLDGLLAASAAASPVNASALPTVADRFPRSRYRAAARTSLWRGDITRLAADAIVNAANEQMLGCFIPFHACIDNAINWAAGPRLRADCDRIMRRQGHAEPTGTAKATRAYNLPSRFVLHTVGPIVRGALAPADEAALASCYRSCLDLAVRLPDVRSVAFCSISRGVFGFPKREAARVALDAVAAWTAAAGRPDLRIVFNVFAAEDERIYAEAVDALP